MKNPVKRLIGTIMVALVSLVVYTVLLLNIEQRHNSELIMSDSINKTDSIRGMIEGYGRTADEIGKGFCEDENARVKLETIRLLPQVAGGEYTGERLWNNGMVVRVQGGKTELPTGAEALASVLTADMITNEYEQTRTEMPVGAGTAAQEQVLVTCGKISGDWYYVRWTPASEYDDYIRSRISVENLTEAMENVNDIELLVVPSPDSAEGESESTILHATKGFAKYSALGDLGLTGEDLKKESFSLSTGDGKEYICFPIAIENLGYTALCCNSVENEKMAVIGDIIGQILFAAVMLAGLITWCFSVQWLVRREKLTEKKRERYTPAVVKRRTTRLTIMATLVVTLFGFITVMVQYMYQENRIGTNVLNMLETQLRDGGRIENELSAMGTEKYIRLGETVSDMLSGDPSLLAKDKMAEISKAISADYMILYDENGAEIACSRDYKGFTLPTDKSDSFSDFQRLLKGVPVIVHEAEKDMITGERYSFVGVRYDIPGKEDTYGALLLAMAPSAGTSAQGTIEDQVKQQVYRRLQSKDRVIMEIDPQTKKIVLSSRDAYIGADIGALGMDEKMLRDRYMNFFFLDDEWYFGIVGKVGDNMYFYLRDSTDMSRIGLLLALVSGGLFMIAHVITAKFGFAEYNDENYERYAPQVLKTSEEYRDKIREKAPYMESLADKWTAMMPENKAKAVMQILIGILLVALILVSYSNSPLARHSVLSFVIRGNWTKGINLFSGIAVVVTFCIEYLAYLTLKMITLILVSLTDTKGETIFKLVRSFLNYAMFIGAVCVSLSFLGVDTTTLLASIGLLSLAISLGAKDIVADILAGLSIVFERNYYVGDIVRIGDFKGKVKEIGVRSTKVTGGSNEVKIISNHEIGSVINYSMQTSVCSVKLNLPVTVSIEEIRKLFDEELPKVKEMNPYIVKGPNFDGIQELVDDRMIISISAEGPEEQIGSIQLDLNRVLQSMVNRGLLEHPKTNVTINMGRGSVSLGEDSITFKHHGGADK